MFAGAARSQFREGLQSPELVVTKSAERQDHDGALIAIAALPSPSNRSAASWVPSMKNSVEGAAAASAPSEGTEDSAEASAAAGSSAAAVASEQAVPDGVNGARNVMDLTVDEIAGNGNQVAGVTKIRTRRTQQLGTADLRRRHNQRAINDLIFRTTVGTHNASNGKNPRSEDEVHNSTHGISRRGGWMGSAARLPKGKLATLAISEFPMAEAASAELRLLPQTHVRTVLRSRRGLSTKPVTPWTMSHANAASSRRKLDQADTSTTISVDPLRRFLPEGAKLTAGPAWGKAKVLRSTFAPASASRHANNTDAVVNMAETAKGADASPAVGNSADCVDSNFAASEALPEAGSATADTTASPLGQRSTGQSDDEGADCVSGSGADNIDAENHCIDVVWLDICNQMLSSPRHVQVTLKYYSFHCFLCILAFYFKYPIPGVANWNSEPWKKFMLHECIPPGHD